MYAFWPLHSFNPLPMLYEYIRKALPDNVSQDSSVGIATRYGPDGPGIKSRWRLDFLYQSRRPWGQPSLLYNVYRVFPWCKAAGGVALTTHPHPAPRLKKE